MFKNSRKDGAYAPPVRPGGGQDIAEKRKLLATLLPKYRTEMVAP
jgi:hypothetical protein